MTEPLVERKTRSYSQLTTYMECPKAFHYKYRERIPETPAIWSAGGTAFHTCAEWFLTGRLGDTPAEVQWAWTQAFAEAVAEITERDPAAAKLPLDKWRKANRGTEGLEWWSKFGPRMVQDFIDWRHTKGSQLVVLTDSERSYIEARLNVTMGDVPVLAIPDLVVIDEYGQADIIDYKSGKRAPTSSLQPGVYKVALLLATGIEAQWGMYYLARKAQLVPHDLSQWTVEVITDMFTDFDTRERAGRYPAKPGDACKFCTYKTICPEAL